MSEYDDLAAAIQSSGYEVYWYGASSAEKVSQAERLLGVTFPVSFRRFLESYGGGGVVTAEVSGIDDNDPDLTSGGTLIGDTNTCRDRYSLPRHLVVIYFHDDEVCWCIDTSRSNGGEAPVVSYNIFARKVDRDIAPDFSVFMRDHLSLYTAAD